MEKLSEKQREEAFRKELHVLKDRGYLSQEKYKEVKEAHQHYLKSKIFSVPESQSAESVSVEPEEKQAQKPKPPKPKKVKTKAQIRERNITWSLILGVVLLLISGLVVATSNWEQMGPGLKVFSIAFVSLFFFGLSYISRKLLKIKQTAFAFLTLGSLLIPIGILAIGYFQLLGSYLSLEGEGRYLLGFIGTVLPMPVFVRNAVVHRSRLFVWVSFVFLSLAVGFGLETARVPVDVFYLGIMVFNGVLLWSCFRFRSLNKIELFIKEIPVYAQANLVLSTLLMLVFYNNEIIYSVNVILTACLYMAMVYVYKRKEYQFVFCLLFVYGIYQFTEHSPLREFDVFIYALTGLLYIGFAAAVKEDGITEKVFIYASGFISLCAFIYISFEGFVLHYGEASLLLCLGYLAVAVNYFILTNITKQKLFEYLTAVFLFVALGEFGEWIDIVPIEWFLFAAAVIVNVSLGLLAKQKWLTAVKESSFFLSLLVLAGCMSYTIQMQHHVQLAFMLIIVSALSVLVYQLDRNKDVAAAAKWTHPVSFILACLAWLPWLEEHTLVFKDHIGTSGMFAIAGLLIIGISLGWGRTKKKELAIASFYCGQAVYAAAIAQSVFDPVLDPVLVRPLILAVGMVLFAWLVVYSKVHFLWALVSITAFSFYVSLISTFAIEYFQSVSLYLMGAPIWLIGLGTLGRKRWKSMEPYFFWVAHIALPVIIAHCFIGLLIDTDVHPFLLLVPVAVYVYSALKKDKEWQVKLLLYVGMSVVHLLLFGVWLYYELWPLISITYVWLASSLVFTCVWVAVPVDWKRRIEWFIVPFSLVGLVNLIYHEGELFDLELIPLIGYIVLNLYFLQIRKWPWIQFLPLLASVMMWLNFSEAVSRMLWFVFVSAGFFVLTVAGRHFYPLLVEWKKDKKQLDPYSVTAVMYVPLLCALIRFEDSIWLKILPLLLLACWLIIHSKRLFVPLAERIFQTLAAGSLYTAYVMVLGAYEANIPDLIEAELRVLPVILVMIAFRLYTWRSYRASFNYVQWGVLLFLSAYLVIDAIDSHTIYDAWIIGGLSLLSMISGMQLKIKSYFFVGMGVLVFNVMYQTRPFWGNMPWWVYLLVAGFLLITVASYNEWKKQKEPGERKLETKLKKMWTALKKWE
ncbi:hypothetical protein MUN89_00320 [Halobacillus salinarum]|uniref:DUF2157 domain-containing protein n=1 Tax=Halobacillus salinarum TaxID=2932257 RepID=A0ABY4EKT5_9BACI|nr:hypothetical protein [Halobacillus salinarum]UOQ44478.1 hypothetical protein MUN89_00320 [Halobacillus salinarum]